MLLVVCFAAVAASEIVALPLVHYTQVELTVAPMPVGGTLAELLAIGNAQRPPEDAVWSSVGLPDLKPRSTVDIPAHNALSQMRWYRLRYERPGAAPDAASPLLGLYIPRAVTGPLSILLREGAQWRVLYQSNERWREEWNRPVLVALPPEAGPQIEIVVGASSVVERGLHVLSSMWIGPFDAVRWRADWRSLLQLQAPMATSLAILIVGLFALGVWWRRRHKQAYLYFALAAAWSPSRTTWARCWPPCATAWAGAWKPLACGWIGRWTIYRACPGFHRPMLCRCCACCKKC